MLAQWCPSSTSALAELVLLSPTKLILVLILIIGVPRLCKNVKHVHWVYHLNIQLYVPFKDF